MNRFVPIYTKNWYYPKNKVAGILRVAPPNIPAFSVS